MKNFELPARPTDQSRPVWAWSEPVVLPTFDPAAPDKNPMFLESRVYQGSSGRVYPIPITDRIESEPRDRAWTGLHIENEFLRVMVLPEIGGRIHVGLDKRNGYDFFYRQNVIKPALVGLAGPWASGGVEFNWPQHHRPDTYSPVDWEIEHNADGSSTIWCGAHDPMNRLKGMHGVCLRPGAAYIELKVRLYNRTPFVQTFLWWANVATRVHELYQSFFPFDVHYVADHARRAMSSYPLCTSRYYGVDYGTRARTGVPPDERPTNFLPPGTYPPNDLRWYANIPVPTSYMAMGSHEDFHGGYDHRADAGLVLIANHHIAPGKKQWTWGNQSFGYAWDRNLTENDGPYIEIMAGVYTDNQPDFSFLGPGETKSFSHHWFPIREIGVPQAANVNGALSLTTVAARARISVAVTQEFPSACIRLESNGKTCAQWVRDLTPGKTFIESADLPSAASSNVLVAIVQTKDGHELLRYCSSSVGQKTMPLPAVEPLPPEQVSTIEQLFFTGVHLEQYRHATRSPEPYWREALRRDPGDSRTNNALGRWHMQRGEFDRAERHFRTAIQRLIELNSNPFDGEPYYNLGLALRYQDRDQDAYDAFYKAAWNQAWQSAAYLALAQLDLKTDDLQSALNHLQSGLRRNSDDLRARNLLTVVLQKRGDHESAARLLGETRALDPLDIGSRHLANERLLENNQTLFDLALEYAICGMYDAAVTVLNLADESVRDGSVPMVLYAKAYLLNLANRTVEAQSTYARAAQVAPDYCFPVRLEEISILQAAIEANPRDARAPYYLGNLLFDRRRHHEALEFWERSAQLDPSYSVVWRNLGIAYFNILQDVARAREAFDRALACNPLDARVLYERDQLWKRIGEAPATRLKNLESAPALVSLRHDLSIELVTLYNQTGQYAKALATLQSHSFQPWEGGEGLAIGQHVRTHLALGRKALSRGEAAAAMGMFESALACPANLGETAHFLANQSDIYYWLGAASDAAGDALSAQKFWERAAKKHGDFQEMKVKSYSPMTYYNALALKRLGKTDEANGFFRDLLLYARNLREQPVQLDYFATSLPHLLLFNDDLQKRNAVTATFLEAQAQLGLGESVEARALLDQVLALDRNHDRAADLIAEIEMVASVD
jgi:tetratricopeptide (TPR) repeat protein